MHPVLIRLKFLPAGYQDVYSYGFMLALGFLAGTVLAYVLLKKTGQDPSHLLNLALLALVCGLAGARIFFVVHYWQNYAGGPVWRIMNIRDGGLELYGGLGLAILAIFVYLMVRKLPVLLYLDALAPVLMLGLAFGRLGCFLHGCCYGKDCDLSWAVSFPYGSFAYRAHLSEGKLTVPEELSNNRGEFLPFMQLDESQKPLALQQRSLPVHPAQLYSSANGLLLCGILWWYFRRRKYDGQVLILALLLYGLSRIALEVVRTEPGLAGTGLSVSQIVSLLALALAVILWFWLGRRIRTAGRVDGYRRTV